MFSSIEAICKNKPYQLCGLSDGDNTKKKNFWYLCRKARKETYKPFDLIPAFIRAGYIPFDPESVTQRPHVFETIIQPPQSQSTVGSPQTLNSKRLKTKLHHVLSHQLVVVDEKLASTYGMTTKAIGPLGTKDAETAQHYMK